MSMPLPFCPASTATLGKTVKVASGTGQASVPSTIPAASSAQAIVVTNAGAVLTFVRISAEAVPVCTAADYPMLPGSQIVLSNPATGAIVGIAVLSSTATSSDIYFTPGEGQ